MTEETRTLQCKNCGNKKECSLFLRPYMCYSCGAFPTWEEVSEVELLSEDEVRERLNQT